MCGRASGCYHYGIEGRRLWRAEWDRSTRMAWKGKFFGALIGFLITRNVWGAVMGAIVGHMFDQSAGVGYAGSAYATAAAEAVAGGAPYASVSEVFFRTTFELIGHVAKSDGRVSEAEISAARRLMQELRLGP